jgi:uncharacterized protein
MESPFASAMDRSKIYNPTLEKNIDPEDALFTSLQRKGEKHEKQFIEKLKLAGHCVFDSNQYSVKKTLNTTLVAMQEGKNIITGGYLSHEQFSGISDILAKVPGDSLLGDYHYEVWDIKLSKIIKPYFAIQLCCYVEMLQHLQGIRPEFFTIVLGNNQQKRLRVENYFAYYQSLKTKFLSFHNRSDIKIPHPSGSNSFGRWSNVAKSILEEQDHLSQVANLSRVQIKKIESSGITTMQGLSVSREANIPGMLKSVLSKAKTQAALQIASKGLAIPKYIILPHDKGGKKGLALLPPHSDSDIFFDIEGYPGDDGGLEYLWGNTYFDHNGNKLFKDFWAHDAKEEKQTFIKFIDWVYDRWKRDPSLHIYHYANYEIAAIRKLMGRYGVCEDQVDNLLRNNVFVDLYSIVRHGIMIGEPRYSIKNVEHIYREKRNTDVASGGDSIVVYENWRNNPDGLTWKTSAILKSIRDYNIDDCESTQELTVWLREEKEKHNIEYLLPNVGKEQQLSEEINETIQLREKLLTKSTNSHDIKERETFETLAWALEFHRRENKPVWWKMFDRMGWSEHEIYDDMECLGGLVRTSREPFLPTIRSRNKVYEYKFDTEQLFKGIAKYFYVLEKDNLKITCHEYNSSKGIISFQSKEILPEYMNIIPDEYVNPNPIPKAIKNISEKLLNDQIMNCAIKDFLRKDRPRIRNNMVGNIIKSKDNFLQKVIEAVINLDHSYLCIQGPPGTGKTYTAKNIIGKLLQQGKTVGVASNSHKAITNLLSGVADYINKQNIEAKIIKVGGDNQDILFEMDNASYIKSIKDFKPLEALCLGGTAWSFSNNSVKDTFDYLFIDEAGQVSIANLIAMSQSCKNIILMGDQMQLGQPLQGSHPGQSSQSILEYLLEDKATIADDIGIFLPITYRMHPDICRVISDQVYEGKLQSDITTSKHVLKVKSNIIKQNSGICYISTNHEGNTQGSNEEVSKIKNIAHDLLNTEYWPDTNGKKRYIGWQDMLFVAPYNYQVTKLQSALGNLAQVGSIDKFQGQEAPIVILSMCASNASETPRGIDFLFSKNRLNVAISRSQSLAIIVGNTNLAFTPATNLKQMELINFYCKLIFNENNIII